MHLRISMLKGVTLVKKQKQKECDITKTKGFQEALDDVKHGRVTHYDSVDDMFKSVLGEEAFSKIRSKAAGSWAASPSVFKKT